LDTLLRSYQGVATTVMHELGEGETKSRRYSPVMSLAQMTCEALLARFLASERGDDVIVIHATQHYICF
jgi:hypothetical protein